MVIHPNQLATNESMVLDNLNRALEHSMQYAPDTFKKVILNPVWVGELILPRPPGGKEKDSYIGLSYDMIRAVNDTDSSIEGVILDTFGIGTIKGIQSTAGGKITLKFEKQRVTESGLSKDVGLTYLLQLSSQGVYSGRIENYYGSKVELVKRLDLMKDDGSKIFTIKRALEDYYKEFVIADIFGTIDNSRYDSKDRPGMSPIF